VPPCPLPIRAQLLAPQRHPSPHNEHDRGRQFPAQHGRVVDRDKGFIAAVEDFVTCPPRLVCVTCYAKGDLAMPLKRKPKTKRPKTARERMSARRKRLRAQGLRPVQHWVPDVRDPRVRADLLRQGRLLARHPENDEIDAWIEAVSDTSGWR
jgi:hypothetical protein